MTGNVRISKMLICECGNIKSSKKAQGCDECQRIDKARTGANLPTARIKRQLAHMDWCGTADLFDALEVSESERWSYYWAIDHLVKTDAVESRRIKGEGVQYRLRGAS